MTFHVPNTYRIRTGRTATQNSSGNNGAFWVPNKTGKRGVLAPLRVIASDGLYWEHVSVSLPERCPSWQEMCFIKHMFWDAEDAVMQLHPPESSYVNNHPYCLHLWRPVPPLQQIPLPPVDSVGIPGLDHNAMRALAGVL